jgi:hypothetical protein
MLLLMLGAVLVLMRQIQQPETVAYLGRIFSSPSTVQTPVARQPNPAESRKKSADDATRRLKAPLGGPWSAVRDNALFTAAEHEAWFLLLDEVRRTPPQELAQLAVPEVTYGQLVNQPDVYRAQPLQVRGRVLRESVKRAPKNSLGISEYHQLVLAPVGGGDWPVILYCLKLPPGFPRGDGLQEDLVAAGLFFKNWSYPYDGGMGVAPVLVAKTIDWKPPRVQAAVDRHSVDEPSLWIGGAATAAVAVLFLVWVIRQTRRPRRDASAGSEIPGLRIDL